MVTGSNPDAPLVVPLGRGVAVDRSLVGGKALGLERSLASGVPCPPAFCVTTAALNRYLEAAGLQAELAALLARADRDGVCRELQRLAFAAELPPELSMAIGAAVDDLQLQAPRPCLLAVRSSAADEDGGDRSFAGLHDTSLGIAPAGVVTAVRACWASLWNEASVAYRAQHGQPLQEASMAVVVQAMVAAEASAVVFTADPMTGATDEVLIHACWGLGLALVDNQVTPSIAAVRKHDLSVRQVERGDQHVRVELRPAGGVIRCPEQRPALQLSAADCATLAELAMDAEQRSGLPMDIEAARGDCWQLVQTRPITTLSSNG
jgi:phosphoenolpyruvate synthase/pyruvate phosphate dikinase